MLEAAVLLGVRTLLLLRSGAEGAVNSLLAPFTCVKGYVLGRIAASHRARHLGRLRDTMATTEDYQTWWLTARRLDLEAGYAAWSEDERRTPYDAESLRHDILAIRQELEGADPHLLMHHLRAALQRYLRGVPPEKLFPYHCGTKRLLEQYTAQVAQGLETLYGAQTLTLADRAAFFHDTLRAHGRSALLLSGGSALGLYHLGVMKGLHDAAMLPRVIAASDLGAALAALVCCRKESQLPSLFTLADVDMEAYERVKRDRAVIKARLAMFFHEGSLVDVPNLKGFLQRAIGDVTFRDAFLTSQRVLNVTAWHVPGAPVVFNHLTTPDVVVWSAVCLSINPNVPGLGLLGRHRDGSLRPCPLPKQRWHRRGHPSLTVVADTPTAPLAELFHVSFHIVSQASALAVPALLLAERGPAAHRHRPPVSRLLTAGARFALTEAAHQLAQVLRWVPGGMECAPSMAAVGMSGSHEGDITIVPVDSLEDFLSVLHVPSKEHTEQCVVHGCRRTWPFMTEVTYHCLIERRLEKCLADLKVAMQISGEAIQDPHTPTAAAAAAPGFAESKCPPRPDGEEAGPPSGRATPRDPSP